MAWLRGSASRELQSSPQPVLPIPQSTPSCCEYSLRLGRGLAVAAAAARVRAPAGGWQKGRKGEGRGGGLLAWHAQPA